MDPPIGHCRSHRNDPLPTSLGSVGGGVRTVALSSTTASSLATLHVLPSVPAAEPLAWIQVLRG